MSQLNEFSRYDMDLAKLAFGFKELRIRAYPHLLGIAPEIRKEIFRHLLDVDHCRYEYENEDWIDGYQRTGNRSEDASDYPPACIALRSWLFSNPSPPVNAHCCIRSSSPWKVEMDLHPSILNVNRQLLLEGMQFITSENIFIKVRTDVPDYDVHLQWFGLRVFTYHKRSYDEMCDYERTMKRVGVRPQVFRTMIEIDIRTDQNSLLSKLRHFYLVPFKDVEQVTRALYLTEGREEAWLRFTINLKHVPRTLRPDIADQVVNWISNLRPVGSVSVVIPEEGFENLPIADYLTRPFSMWEFIFAVEGITGLKLTMKLPLPARSKPTEAKDRRSALTQLSRLSSLFAHNHEMLRSLHPGAAHHIATLASAPLYTLLQLEYAGAKGVGDPTNKRALLQRTSSLSLLATSLPPAFHGQRLLTLHTRIHCLAALHLETPAAHLLFCLLHELRMHIHDFNSNNNNNGEAGLDGAGVGVGRGLTKRTRAMVGLTKHALDEGYASDGDWGEVWIMGLWEALVRDGWAIARLDGNGSGSGSGSGSADEKSEKSRALETIWKSPWNGRYRFTS